MNLRFRHPCAVHRTALLDFADRREAGPRTTVALDHLDRCRDCETELAGVALALAALRALRLEVQSVEPASDGWEALKARITRRAASAFPGWMPAVQAFMSAWIVAVVALSTFAVPDAGQPPDVTDVARRGGAYTRLGDPVVRQRTQDPLGAARDSSARRQLPDGDPRPVVRRGPARQISGV